MSDFSVIIPAAGSSTRFGASINKIFLDLNGIPVLTRTLARFAQRQDVQQIVVACHDLDGVSRRVAQLPPDQAKKVVLVAGGTCRAESVRAGLMGTSSRMEWVAVHDAARPLVSDALIDRVFSAALQNGAAAAALPVHLTIKQAPGPLPARVERTLPRKELWAMQTPQAMRRKDLIDAFAACKIDLAQITDDVQLLELSGNPVWLVPGEEQNIKLTSPIDLQFAQSLLNS